MSDRGLATVLAPGDRWRPTRAGLVALWRYWDETFAFHRGRLLLRGPNGSGKSMALELLLPFLLDGDPAPHKLTSAARSRGRLFDRIMTGTDESTRTGFAWVEFARGRHVFTVGARMRASHATGKVDVDLFTTSLAVGRELHLLDAHRSPLSRKALVEAIGTTGRVHGSAEEHRGAVREALFSGFGVDRYESVIGALLALRKEKLSQNLDLDKLSAVLSEALPPIDDHDIAAVAEGFERLDRRRAELNALERELAEVGELARRQRAYARAVVVGVARHVRSAETRRDDVTRNERLARLDLDAAEQRVGEVTDERRALGERDRAIGVELDALKERDAYKAGTGLADLREQARILRGQADRARRAADADEAAHQRALAEREDTAGERTAAGGNLERARDDLAGAAEPLGAAVVLSQAEAIDDTDEAEGLLGAWVRGRRERVGEVRQALARHDDAVRRRGFLEDQVAADEGAADARRAEHAAAEGAAGTAVAAYQAAVDTWAAGCDTIGADRLTTALPRPPADPAAVQAALATVGAELGAEHAVAGEQLAARRQAGVTERAELVAERSRWEAGGLIEPAGPLWRSDRRAWGGAPLWRLVDLAGGVDAAAVDGLEAALAGAGLLDAWVQPDGAVDLGPDRADVVVTARRRPGRTLASVLVPAADAGDAGVAAGVVAEILASIAVAEAGTAGIAGTDAGEGPGTDVVVATDGSYRLGAAVGRGPLRPAMLLGAAARERHRRVRLAELDAAIAEVDARLAELDRAGEDLARRRAAIEAELAAAPAGDAVDEAGRALEAAAVRLAEAGDRLANTRRALRQAEDAVRDALRALSSLAARHGLPADGEGLARVESALEGLKTAAATWARRRRDLAAADRRYRRAERAVEDAGQAAVRSAADRAAADGEATGVEQRVAALESSVGAEYGEILERISALNAERSANRTRADGLEIEQRDLAEQVGALRGAVAAAERERLDAEHQRDLVHGQLVMALRNLAGDAGTDTPAELDGVTGVLAAGRAIAAAHEALDTAPAAVERLSERVRERVHLAQATLGARVDIERQLVDAGWWVLRATTGGIRRDVSQLQVALTAELDQGRAELAADEERLFEQTLAGSVRRALAERIRAANALVDGINDQLGAVRTAAGGVQVRLRWDVDADQPGAVKAARSLLLRDPAGLSGAERASLQEFVRARVDQARSDLEADAPWEARLRETLDYRAWHRFILQVGHRDWAGYRAATPRLLQKLSTGERSIALHLPMMASVAAHYAGEAGEPSSCPRLILLDELFAGVDAANRAKLFGTFSTWDLDAVFTSDHEWCQYATLDGIAIHHLHPPTGDEPVTSTRFTWDGRQRQIDPSVEQASA